MADVFLSYTKADAIQAAKIAAALANERLTVFYDANVAPGDSWDARIEQELAAAAAIVVLWSFASRDRQWVRNEARYGLRKGNLCPVFVASCQPPLEFDHVQGADLTDPNFLQGPEWSQFIAALRDLAQPSPVAPEADAPLSEDDEVEALHPDVRRWVLRARDANARADGTCMQANEAVARARDFAPGTKIFSDDIIEYEGEWNEGANGLGIMQDRSRIIDGRSLIYQGEFVGGKPNGVGIAYLPEGGAYGGEFENGRASGAGIRYDSSRRYEGAFKDNLPNGFGASWSEDGRLEQAGLWETGVLRTSLQKKAETESALCQQRTPALFRSPGLETVDGYCAGTIFRS